MNEPSWTPNVSQHIQRALDQDGKLRRFIADTAEVKPPHVTPRTYVEVMSLLAACTAIEKMEQPGWTLLATDVHGLPFDSGWHTAPHCTWARRDACGTVSKLTKGRTECSTCPPIAQSRTHRAKAGSPQLLYPVRYGDLLKFGHGDARRVRAHLRAGARRCLFCKQNINTSSQRSSL
jgi:hypothetical protein